ncbi:hypothetical protein SPONN_22 [uncultured Candidatus Thioglobus sp.]|nr:hypothetical protein SPONN_22 [uncultured Candidatus Thioglobus sp.]
MEDNLQNIMNEMTAAVQDKYPEDSFRRLFWEHQLEALKTKESRQIRWPPAIIKWCLHLKYLSSGSYNALRSTLLVLPSERTLRDYTHFVKAGIGFKKQDNDQLLKEVDVTNERERHVVLMWDEMKIKNDLVYDKHSCEIVGFTNIGEINNTLDTYEYQCKHPDSNMPREVATHTYVGFYGAGIVHQSRVSLRSICY